MRKRTTLILLGSLLATPVFAFHGEVGLGYQDATVDFEGVERSDRDVTSLALSGRYYFKDIDTSKGPLGLAAYLDRASYLSGFYLTGEYDFSYADYDIDSLGISGRFIDVDSGWLAGGALSRTNLDFNRSVDIDYYDVHVGKYLAENTRAIVWLSRRDTDRGFETVDDNAITITLSHLGELHNSTHYFVSVGIQLLDASDGDDAKEISASAYYYPTQAFSIGLNLSYADGEYTKTKEYKVNAKWFATDDFSVSLAYQFVTKDNKYGFNGALGGGVTDVDTAAFFGTPDVDSNTWFVNVAYRF